MDRLGGTGAVAFRPTPWGAWLVGTAAHPVGGDQLTLDVRLGPDCELTVRSVSATLARRGPSTGQSGSRLRAEVGDGGILCWKVEPGIAAAGSDHLAEADVHLTGRARLIWWDEFVLGRWGEPPGTWRSRLRVSIGGVPIVASELAAGPSAPGWRSTAVLAGAPAYCSLTVIDPVAVNQTVPSHRLSGNAAIGLRSPLEGPGVHCTAWGDRLEACRAVVHQLLPAGTGWDWVAARLP